LITFAQSALALPNGPRDLTVAEEGDNLTAQLAGQSAIPLLYLGNDTFGVAFDRALRFIFTMDGARAAKITLLQGGRAFRRAAKVGGLGPSPPSIPPIV
jgi:hypothetical protein